MKKVKDVSEVFCRVYDKRKYRYGFTVSYQNGEFKNFIYESELRNDAKLILKINQLREKLISNEVEEITSPSGDDEIK